MLETLRALSAGQPLRNDLIFLFTDGEELGWKGAYLIQAHPEAKNEVGALLVFDALPGNAPLSLLETSPGDAWLVRQMAGLPLPFWTGPGKISRNGRRWIPILMSSSLPGTPALSSRTKLPAPATTRTGIAWYAISPRVVQAYGKTMLALTNRFGAVDITSHTQGPDLVFFTLSLLGL